MPVGPIHCQPHRDALRRFVSDLESTYTDERLEEFKQQVTDIDSTAVEDFLKELPEIVRRYRTATPLPLAALQQAAEEYVRAKFATGPLTCLGVGEEGVVLTDGRLVYKYFHYWRARDRSARVAFLKSLAGKVSGYRSLPDLLEVREQGDQVVAVYPYEEGTEYAGGHLGDLLTLLREARRAGIACLFSALLGEVAAVQHPHCLGVPQPGSQVFLQPPCDHIIGPTGLRYKPLHRPGLNRHRLRKILGVAPLLGLHQQGL